MTDNFDTHKWFKDQYLNEGDILDETDPNQEFLDIVRDELNSSFATYLSPSKPAFSQDYLYGKDEDGGSYIDKIINSISSKINFNKENK
jgi:hypothetical protein